MTGADAAASADSFAATLGGRWPDAAAADRVWAGFRGASIDSRKIRAPRSDAPGPVFFAIRGGRTDGHRFVGAALEAGAAAAVVDNPDAARDVDAARVCVAPDARRALGDLARSVAPRHRIVAVTGSNGKTTTVRLIGAVLSEFTRPDGTPGLAHRPERSFNNDLGLPLTILNAPPGVDVVICEAGINAVGEMDRLAEICQPDAAVITSIGRAHLEGLGGLDGVAREKAKLIDGLKAAAGRDRGRPLVVVPSGCERLEPELASRGALLAGAEVVRVSAADAAGFDVPLAGEHNRHNAACAIAVGRWLGMADRAIAAGLHRAEGAPGRGERVRVLLRPGDPRGPGSIELIDDSYNANPDSMLAAVGVLVGARLSDGSEPGRRVAVLGEMLELGEASAAEHRGVGDRIADRLYSGATDRDERIDLVIAVGRLAAEIAAGVHRSAARGRSPDAAVVEDDAAMPTRIASMLRPRDLVLLKGSRGARLERVRAALEACGPMSRR